MSADEPAGAAYHYFCVFQLHVPGPQMGSATNLIEL
jgi:hypothetical protein